MNIIFLSKEYPPETGWGGIGTYVYNIANALSEQGHSVHIISLALTRQSITPLSSPKLRGEKWGLLENIHVHRIRPVRFPTPFLNHFLLRSLEIIKFNIAIILKIKKLMKKVKFDIIEAPEWRSEAFLLSFIKPKGVPLVIKCHSPSVLLNEIYNPPSPPLNKGGDGGIDTRCVEWMEKITIHNADLVLSPSKNLADIVSEKMGIKRDNIRIVPNPIDTEIFSPKSPLPPFNKGGITKVLFVGRLDRIKGAHIFVSAIALILKEVSDTSFILIGRDTNTAPNNSSMKSYMENLLPPAIKDRVIFLGNVERNGLVNHYRESDICVVPSFYENFPNSVLEAMSCGKAVIASNTGGIPEVIEDEVSGLLVKTGDVHDLAEKIIRLLKDKEMRELLGINARKRIEGKYSNEVVAKETETTYQGLKTKT
ncbi:MAG: glycosyltransferase family 4 protein [Nitrospinae bacterium]|nr:glycosyltransferase family 4 protein [Nitrospinota bacterium]